MSNRATIFIGFLLFCVAMAASALYTVDQRLYAIVLQFGEIKKVIVEPGLYIKVPLIQNTRFFDKRILTMDTPEPERFITSEKKNVLVDLFVKWQIVDPKLYYESVNGDELRARTRIEQTVNANLREEFGKRTVHEVVSGQRDAIMDDMRLKADQDAKKIGVKIIDVRLKRVDLPSEVSGSVFSRMEAERKRVANELRSEGFAEAEKIRADADRQREVIIADAYSQAQQIKGKGDAQASEIYSRAFSRDTEFYAFYRSQEAYRNTFKSKSDVLVLEPSNEFFRYLGKSRAAP